MIDILPVIERTAIKVSSVKIIEKYTLKRIMTISHVRVKRVSKEFARKNTLKRHRTMQHRNYISKTIDFSKVLQDQSITTTKLR